MKHREHAAALDAPERPENHECQMGAHAREKHRPLLQLRPPRRQLSRKLGHVSEPQAPARAQSHDGKRKSIIHAPPGIVRCPHLDGSSRAVKRGGQFFTIRGRAATEGEELVGNDHDP